jgi:hypothetical protein
VLLVTGEVIERRQWRRADLRRFRQRGSILGIQRAEHGRCGVVSCHLRYGGRDDVRRHVQSGGLRMRLDRPLNGRIRRNREPGVRHT